MAVEPSQYTDHELELQSSDLANFPIIKERGLLYWTGAAWAKVTGSGGGINVNATILTSPITVTGTVTADTELPAAAALADGVSSTNVEPRVAADMQGLRPDGTANSDRAVLTKMQDLDTGAGTEYVASTTERVGASGGSIAKSFATGVRDAGTQRVTIATNDLVPVSIASGQVASGAIASGAVASGAIASGAVASGAVASGAFASGSVSDGAVVTLGAKADAKNSATDTTSITIMQVLKQISQSVQNPSFLAGKVAVPYAVRINSNTTTTPTAATAYIKSIVITTEVIGTTSTITIQSKEATPKVLVPALTTVAVGLTTYNFSDGHLMTSGFDIITAGAVAATVDVFIVYYQ